MTITSEQPKTFQPGHGYTQEDWDAVNSPELIDEELANTRPARAVLPPSFFEAIEDMRRHRGRPKIDAPKAAVTLRLDPDVVEKFKAQGKNWRSNMSDALRKAAGL